MKRAEQNAETERNTQMNSRTNLAAVTRSSAARDALASGTPATPASVPRQGRGSGRHRVHSGDLGGPSATAGPALAPAKVELVERFDTGDLYLRAYIDGHFYWQPVTSTAGEIPDAGLWTTGRHFHDSYWFNYGPYRRRAGRYYPVTPGGAPATISIRQ
jgi:hypothetical protein